VGKKLELPGDSAEIVFHQRGNLFEISNIRMKEGKFVPIIEPIKNFGADQTGGWKMNIRLPYPLQDRSDFTKVKGIISIDKLILRNLFVM
jgi:hypothetical protein